MRLRWRNWREAAAPGNGFEERRRTPSMSNANAKSDGWDGGGGLEVSWRKCRVLEGDDAWVGEGNHLGRNLEEREGLDTEKEQ